MVPRPNDEWPRGTPTPGSHPMLPTSLAALAAGVSEATIRKWVSRGKLTRYGSPGRAEFAVAELMDLVKGSSAPSRSSAAASDPEANGEPAPEG